MPETPPNNPDPTAGLDEALASIQRSLQAVADAVQAQSERLAETNQALAAAVERLEVVEYRLDQIGHDPEIPDPDPPPAAVQNVTVAWTDDGTFLDVGWDAAPGAAEYGVDLIGDNLPAAVSTTTSYRFAVSAVVDPTEVEVISVGATGVVGRPVMVNVPPRPEPDPTTPPARPAGIVVVQTAQGEAMVSWAAVPDADTYAVDLDPGSIEGGITATSHIRSGLAPGSYFFQIEAFNEAGGSGQTAQVPFQIVDLDAEPEPEPGGGGWIEHPPEPAPNGSNFTGQQVRVAAGQVLRNVTVRDYTGERIAVDIGPGGTLERFLIDNTGEAIFGAADAIVRNGRISRWSMDAKQQHAIYLRAGLVEDVDIEVPNDEGDDPNTFAMHAYAQGIPIGPLTWRRVRDFSNRRCLVGGTRLPVERFTTEGFWKAGGKMQVGYGSDVANKVAIMEGLDVDWLQFDGKSWDQIVLRGVVRGGLQIAGSPRLTAAAFRSRYPNADLSGLTLP